MPDPKGRRRRGRQRDRPRRAQTEPTAPQAVERAESGATPPVVSPRRIARRQTAPGAGPSPTARATGLMLAVVTAFLAGLLIRDSGGSPGPIIAGVLLVALAVVVAVLVAAPGRVRSLLRR